MRLYYFVCTNNDIIDRYNTWDEAAIALVNDYPELIVRIIIGRDNV